MKQKALSVAKAGSAKIVTPDQRLRIFVSSTLKELAPERGAVRAAVESLHLTPVMFELGARPHPPRDLYRAYLEQSHVFVGIYWESYGWIAPGMEVSGLEDEYMLAADKPRLIYVKGPAPARDERLQAMLEGMDSWGAHCYKQFANVEELSELVASDLAVLLSERFEVPLTAAADRGDLAGPARGNLPVPPNPLVGRESELDAASSLLLSADTVLVTLVGTGGCGKTRLALEIGRRLQDRFPDGVFFVKLEAIVDPKLVVPTIATTLDLGESVGALSMKDLLKRYVRERSLLLVLDNFEQVIEAAREIADLLEVCSITKLLVTTRAPLRIRAERVLDVLPLDTPPSGLVDPDELAQYPVVQLFLERTRAVRPDFNLSVSSAEAVGDICRRLEGLPLAIELAAARSRIFTPGALMARLDHRFEVLRGGPSDAPQRHSTLYQTIDWSYNLLRASEQTFFSRLSVFSGGFTLEAAEAVCATDMEDGDALTACEALIDGSLLRAPGGIEPGSRLRMLETIREFAQDRLVESGEADEFYANHARYFLTLAESADAGAYLHAQDGRHRLLEAELDNLRAAMTWGLTHNDPELALRIATAVWTFWWYRGYWREGLDWLQKGLKEGSAVCPQVRAYALIRSGWLSCMLSDNLAATTSLGKGIELSRKTGDRAATALGLSNLGAVVMSQGRYDEAISLLEEALHIRRELGKAAAIYPTLMNLAIAHAEQSHNEQAVELYKEALSLARAENDQNHVGLILINLAEQYVYHRDLDLAEESLAEAELISQHQGNRMLAGLVAQGHGRVALRRGDLEHAADLLTATALSFQEMGDIDYMLMNLELLAEIAGERADWQRAAALLGTSEALRESLMLAREPRLQVEFDRCWAAACDALGEAELILASTTGRAMTLEEAVAYAVAGRLPMSGKPEFYG